MEKKVILLLFLTLLYACTDKHPNDEIETSSDRLKALTNTYCGYEPWRYSSYIASFEILGTENLDSFIMEASTWSDLYARSLPVKLCGDSLIFAKDSFIYEQYHDGVEYVDTLSTYGYGVEATTQEGWIFTFINQRGWRSTNSGNSITVYDTLVYWVLESSAYPFEGSYARISSFPENSDTILIEKLAAEGMYRVRFASNEDNPLENKEIEVYGEECCLHMDCPSFVNGIEFSKVELSFGSKSAGDHNIDLHTIGTLYLSLVYTLPDVTPDRYETLHYRKLKEN